MQSVASSSRARRSARAAARRVAMASVLLLCGPSGVGKGTLCNLLMQAFPRRFRFSVSHTTRAMRAGECNGEHYHFVTRGEMEHGIAAGAFVEHAHVHGEIYGTSLGELERVSAEGRIALLDVDLHGVRSIMRQPALDAHCVGIVPPSLFELEKRLRGRQTETEEQIQRRLERAQLDIEFCESDPLVEHLIVNRDSWEYGFPELSRIVTKELWPALFADEPPLPPLSP